MHINYVSINPHMIDFGLKIYSQLYSGLDSDVDLENVA